MRWLGVQSHSKNRIFVATYARRSASSGSRSQLWLRVPRCRWAHNRASPPRFHRSTPPDRGARARQLPPPDATGERRRWRRERGEPPMGGDTGDRRHRGAGWGPTAPPIRACPRSPPRPPAGEEDSPARLCRRAPRYWGYPHRLLPPPSSHRYLRAAAAVSQGRIRRP